MKASIIFERISIAVMLAIVYFTSVIPYRLRPVIIIVACLFLLASFFLSRNTVIIVDKIMKRWFFTLVIIAINMMINSIDQFYLLFYFVCTAFVFLSGNNLSDWTSWILKTVLYMSLFFAIFTIIQVLFPSFYTLYIAPLMNENSTFNLLSRMRFGIYSGFTYQAGVNSMYLAMGIGAAFILLQFERKMVYIPFIAIDMLCILFSGKRAHIIFSIISVLVVSYIISSRKKKVIAIIKILIATTLLIILAYIFIPSANYFFKHLFNSEDDISNGRIKIYLSAIDMFKEHPFFGIGWEQFRYSYIRYIDVHNIYLQLLCETGILGTVFFMWFFMSSLAITIKYLKVNKKNISVNNKKSLSFSLYCQLFFLLYGLTGNGLYDYYVYFFYILGIIILIRTRKQFAI